MYGSPTQSEWQFGLPFYCHKLPKLQRFRFLFSSVASFDCFSRMLFTLMRNRILAFYFASFFPTPILPTGVSFPRAAIDLCMLGDIYAHPACLCRGQIKPDTLYDRCRRRATAAHYKSSVINLSMKLCIGTGIGVGWQ